ncbi:unnamed protein product [Fusarium venenatum]|uniref:F-box domain-containing protein n=1 Tax=Fusarium venenatum TaxID=56646 RepID=A0A2L2TJU1_9HYPO|nr:uncharacterized protein FVRRES_04966 [Fusarium venenatum]KAH6992092.1 hypothetical protein EDB82DRAFT_473908 [Fusarium venenatum]CEI60530.1 unnamed protein product [Fusarium venenatum]
MALCAQPRRKPQGIENLLAYTLAKTSSFLDFGEVLNFAQVSRRLNDVVKPHEWVPLHTRHQFLTEKWTNRTQNMGIFPATELLCFECFKIRPVFSFTHQYRRRARDSPEEIWTTCC